MKQIILKWLFIVFTALPYLGVNAQELPVSETHNFQITQGKILYTQEDCPGGDCQERHGTLSGSFTATITGDRIAFSNVSMKSDLSNAIGLPEDPYTDIHGVEYDANFSFDGKTLFVEGFLYWRDLQGQTIIYSVVAEVYEVAPIAFDQNGYFLARQDLRECGTPFCGGIFVKHVNHKRMQCPDGRFRAECYVGTPDWGKLGFNPFTAISGNLTKTLLLKGTTDYGVKLVASQFYLPVRAPQPAECQEGYKRTNSGCITTNGCEFPLLELVTYAGAVFDRSLNPPATPISHECVAACEAPALPVGNGYCALDLP